MLDNVLYQEFGAVLERWIDLFAYDVSADGTFITGEGTNPSGDVEAWIAYLESDEPDAEELPSELMELNILGSRPINYRATSAE